MKEAKFTVHVDKYQPGDKVKIEGEVLPPQDNSHYRIGFNDEGENFEGLWLDKQFVDETGQSEINMPVRVPEQMPKVVYDAIIKTQEGKSLWGVLDNGTVRSWWFTRDSELEKARELLVARVHKYGAIIAEEPKFYITGPTEWSNKYARRTLEGIEWDSKRDVTNPNCSFTQAQIEEYWLDGDIFEQDPVKGDA